MAKTTIIEGKNFRWYADGAIWVSEDGTEAYQPGKIKGTKQKMIVKIDKDGYKHVKHTWGHIVGIAKAVVTCFCVPKPNDGKRYVINHKDGNISNCHRYNLEWKLDHYNPTTADSIPLKYGKEKFTVKKDGTVWIKGKQEKVYDYIYDPDVDLHACISPHLKFGQMNEIHVDMDEIMKKAGYVNGDDAVLNHPVILHRDHDRMNFASDNLEWVESDDPRYIAYLAKSRVAVHNRDVELNPGRSLPLGW